MPETTITAVRGSQLLPFIRHLENCGMNASDVLRRCACPVSIDFEGPNCCVPTKRFWQVVEETAWLLKDPASTWEIAEKYGLQGSRYLGYLLENQSTLLEALHLYIDVISRHSNSATLELQTRGPDLWLLRTHPLQRSTNFPQVEIYFAGLLIHIIRSYLGARWQPEQISICGTSRPGSRHPLADHCAKLHTGSEQLGIALPIDCLDQAPRRIRASIQSPGTVPAALPTEDHEILKCMLHCYMDDYPLTRPSISEILGLQPKTLSRLLSKHGASFRAIKNEVLIERAKEELRDNRLSIGEVAKLLQYSHQSAFTRAFEKAVGISPEKFRAAARKPSKLA